MSSEKTEGAAFGAAHAQSYAEGARRQVPGLDGLHRMTGMLLAECVPDAAQILVLGAGGGLELQALAEAHAGWHFVGIDPSADMLDTAAHVTEPYRDRVRLQQGYIADAPSGPFDGAVSLLVFHFIDRDARLATLEALRRRLKPGAPLVIAHISFPQDEPERSRWIARHVAFAGTEGAAAEKARDTIGSRLTILAPEDDEAMLRAAGFAGVTLIHVGLSIRGWVAYATK
ncbi:class I SAM-dependent methyltransferase [Pelagibacterium lacus]|uniref:Class I SAM-dependent methyltransferase n=1 Tax=Pelagibacterium lacus TaxID=2282655 RepID=A0A369W8D9_9HYPH|nr:class I SAM-dependent methyltransferase [Pelagibacterium lacus]RDE10239.1 class I SAM-dependent methyltransferase [Pelagibacterium lacus]